MFKLIKRLVCLGVILIAGFLIVSYLFGGEGFRRFGKEVKEKSDKAASTADKIKETTEGARDAAERYQKTISNKVSPSD